ncbi:carboxymuconolactone decarboxylase family protein [Colwellia sp. 4_MG-2023]|jgi:4-carboxymuconolactone decarboxylase|uniref:carboxymuconolactone decarboxylase family protein n=1 Tax=unclassified Colwellia TaxID=196834 RepID=UPI001C0A6307|nr:MULTISPECIES: carboxymuconolactone decarboxylase family protein [unclassified Colwellia]MBU2923664.1 carboxymuconolactone decarboxylase family protein [Colwellia sp. C2M11]MDO6486231.1 carboxymuconolactone decarboxylase family protein [Colwellia sp. 6_MG-2023]MDO6505813.1 carboxymuconolactone decarboxylase family protein [Colwellia sp. 5_MG-2023]MDO6554494.1 carboxymuconolactone decarboxylase family protein [Colwellia sp. 4_MG-2023]MDO6652236.1 carboxymuconolactone decarboxylase family prot
MTITKGEKIRRQVMGEEFVDRALNNADEFTQPMQDFINDHGWGSTWQRSGIDLKTRSLVTIAMLAALRTPQELKGHIRGALNNGATMEEIREVILHSAVYCGAPAAQEAFRAAKEILNNH